MFIKFSIIFGFNHDFFLFLGGCMLSTRDESFWSKVWLMWDGKFYVLILLPSFVNLCVRLPLNPLRTPFDFCRLLSKSTSESLSSESSLSVFLLTNWQNLEHFWSINGLNEQEYLHEGISSSFVCSKAYFCVFFFSRVGREVTVLVVFVFRFLHVYVKPQHRPLISKKLKKMKMMT